MVEKIFWLGHSGVRIESGTVLYIDPFQIADGPEADLILISHAHHDHFSPEDIRKIRGKETVIVTTPDVAAQLTGEVRPVRPGDRLTVGPVAIEAVSAYNLDKPFHPKKNDWVGFILTVDGKRIYYAGDTDDVPEMQALKADIAILPVGGTYTMTAAEAAAVANRLRPEAAIPVHYGTIVGSADDARRFAELCRVPVFIEG